VPVRRSSSPGIGKKLTLDSSPSKARVSNERRTSLAGKTSAASESSEFERAVPAVSLVAAAVGGVADNATLSGMRFITTVTGVAAIAVAGEVVVVGGNAAVGIASCR
jgi:hypothetical protein